MKSKYRKGQDHRNEATTNQVMEVASATEGQLMKLSAGSCVGAAKPMGRKAL